MQNSTHHMVDSDCRCGKRFRAGTPHSPPLSGNCADLKLFSLVSTFLD